MMNSVLFLALTTGFFGGFGHCMGMCGPIVASYALAPGGRPGRSALPAQFIYNAGRITTYVFIGALMGMTGTFIDMAGRMAGVQNLIAVLAGVLMIAAGLKISGLFRGLPSPDMHNSAVMKAVAFVLDGESVWRYYPLGLLMGLMPCGLSYAAFIGAAGSGGPGQGMALLLSFGIGTVPAMMLFGSAVTFLGSRARGIIYRLGGIAIVTMGIAFLIRGIRLYA